MPKAADGYRRAADDEDTVPACILDEQSALTKILMDRMPPADIAKARARAAARR